MIAIPKALLNILPTSVRVQGRSYPGKVVHDLFRTLRGSSDPLCPPLRLNISGDGDFRAKGLENLNMFVELGGLKPSHSVLDVGCGIGRNAVALLDYLSPDSRYVGFDVIRFAVEWCQKNISTRRATFEFVHSDLENSVYNPHGHLRAAEYRFPGDGYDFTYATSVFTHLLPLDAKHYVSEISRTLCSGGHALTTWFISRQGADQKINFEHQLGDCLVVNKAAPEQAIAYPEELIRQFMENSGLTVRSVTRGNWSGSGQYFQDIVVAEKTY